MHALYGTGGPTLLAYLKGRLETILGPKDTPHEPREIFASATAGADGWLPGRSRRGPRPPIHHATSWSVSRSLRRSTICSS